MKKSMVTQVFVFLFSIIVISFGLFLILNFSSGFLSDTQIVKNERFYKEINEDVILIKKRRGDEIQKEYDFSIEIKNICFNEKSNNGGKCVSDNIGGILTEAEFRNLANEGVNVFVFGEDFLEKTLEIPDFKLRDSNGCVCKEIISKNLKVYFVNDRGEVYLEFD